MRFNEVIRSYDFINNADEFFMFKKINGNTINFLVLYVNDILFIDNDIIGGEGVAVKDLFHEGFRRNNVHNGTTYLQM